MVCRSRLVPDDLEELAAMLHDVPGPAVIAFVMFSDVSDWALIWGRRHLERVLNEYVRHYNDERPHRSLALRPPTSIAVRSAPGAVTAAASVRRRDQLGGLVHEYYQVAA